MAADPGRARQSEGALNPWRALVPSRLHWPTLAHWTSAAGALRVERLVDLILPPACADCGCELPEPADRLLLCASCSRSLAGPPRFACRRCGARSAAELPEPDRCPACRGSTFAFDAVRALGDYAGHLRSAVLQMKHPGREPLAFALAELFWRRFGSELSAERFDAVLNTPMHWWRRVRRGTCAPELLASALARKLEIEHLPRGLACRQLRPSQGTLGRSERLANVRGAFAAGRGYRFSGARLLVVDDVLTTGATAGELARVLKRAGAAEVWVCVLARADSDRS